MQIRVLIVDDHEALRQIIGTTLKERQNLTIVGEARNGEEAIQRTHELRPDLIVMDVGMPILDGLSAAEEIKRDYPQTMILIFSAYGLRDFMYTAKRLGLNGYVDKEDGAKLLEAIDAVLHNETYFPSNAST